MGEIKNYNYKKASLFEWILFAAHAAIAIALLVFIVSAGVEVISISNQETSGWEGLGAAILLVLIIFASIALVPHMAATITSLVFSVKLQRAAKNGVPDGKLTGKAVAKIIFAVIDGGFFGYLSVALVTSSPVVGVIACVLTLALVVFYVLTIAECFKRKSLAFAVEGASQEKI